MRWLQRLSFVENNLLWFVLGFTVIGLFLPRIGPALRPSILPVLGCLVLSVSLTVDFREIKAAVKEPVLIPLALFLMFVPMPLVGWGLGYVYNDRSLALGQVLIGSVPVDITAPLLVYLAGGRTALALTVTVIAIGLTPVITPALLLWLGGVKGVVSIPYLMLELFLIVVLPAALGVSLRTVFSRQLERFQPFCTMMASLLYIELILAVVSGSALQIRAFNVYALAVIGFQVGHNFSGYLLGFIARSLTNDIGRIAPVMFLVSMKEFGIVPAVVFSTGLPETAVVPSIFFAVVQMISAPIAAKIIKRYFVEKK